MLQRKKITSPPNEWRNIPFDSRAKQIYFSSKIHEFHAQFKPKVFIKNDVMFCLTEKYCYFTKWSIFQVFDDISLGQILSKVNLYECEMEKCSSVFQKKSLKLN